MALHTIREFGSAGLLDPSTGFVPVVALQLALVASHAVIPSSRRIAAAVLFATAVLQLFGGAIITVLALPFLPFAPDQSIHHYLSHALFGLAQLPLLVTSRPAPFRGVPRSKTPDTRASGPSDAVAPPAPRS